MATQQIEQLERYLYDGRGRFQLGNESLVKEEILCADVGEINETQSLVKTISRGEAERYLLNLQEIIDRMGGSDGLRMAHQAGPLFAEPSMLQRLGEWTQATSGSSQILWIFGPHELGQGTSAVIAALGIIRTAVQSKTQFISYICQRPPYDPSMRNGESKDKTAVLAMVYSLITQLLQFKPPDDRASISQDLVNGFDQSTKSWKSALDLLKNLLQNTPVLRYCIIYGLNNIEYDAMELCRDFVKMILAHASNVHWPIRVLFTTSGQSRVLASLVDGNSVLRTTNTFHQMDGKILYQNTNMAS